MPIEHAVGRIGVERVNVQPATQGYEGAAAALSDIGVAGREIRRVATNQRDERDRIARIEAERDIQELELRVGLENETDPHGYEGGFNRGLEPIINRLPAHLQREMRARGESQRNIGYYQRRGALSTMEREEARTRITTEIIERLHRARDIGDLEDNEAGAIEEITEIFNEGLGFFSDPRDRAAYMREMLYYTSNMKVGLETTARNERQQQDLTEAEGRLAEGVARINTQIQGPNGNINITPEQVDEMFDAAILEWEQDPDFLEMPAETQRLTRNSWEAERSQAIVAAENGMAHHLQRQAISTTENEARDAARQVFTQIMEGQYEGWSVETLSGQIERARTNLVQSLKDRGAGPQETAIYLDQFYAEAQNVTEHVNNQELAEHRSQVFAANEAQERDANTRMEEAITAPEFQRAYEDGNLAIDRAVDIHRYTPQQAVIARRQLELQLGARQMAVSMADGFSGETRADGDTIMTVEGGTDVSALQTMIMNGISEFENGAEINFPYQSTPEERREMGLPEEGDFTLDERQEMGGIMRAEFERMFAQAGGTALGWAQLQNARIRVASGTQVSEGQHSLMEANLGLNTPNGLVAEDENGNSIVEADMLREHLQYFRETGRATTGLTTFLNQAEMIGVTGISPEPYIEAWAEIIDTTTPLHRQALLANLTPQAMAALNSAFMTSQSYGTSTYSFAEAMENRPGGAPNSRDRRNMVDIGRQMTGEELDAQWEEFSARYGVDRSFDSILNAEEHQFYGRGGNLEQMWRRWGDALNLRWLRDGSLRRDEQNIHRFTDMPEARTRYMQIYEELYAADQANGLYNSPEQLAQGAMTVLSREFGYSSVAGRRLVRNPLETHPNFAGNRDRTALWWYHNRPENADRINFLQGLYDGSVQMIRIGNTDNFNIRYRTNEGNWDVVSREFTMEEGVLSAQQLHMTNAIDSAKNWMTLDNGFENIIASVYGHGNLAINSGLRWADRRSSVGSRVVNFRDSNTASGQHYLGSMADAMRHVFVGMGLAERRMDPSWVRNTSRGMMEASMGEYRLEGRWNFQMEQLQAMYESTGDESWNEALQLMQENYQMSGYGEIEDADRLTQ